jgi:hypothetical protein
MARLGAKLIRTKTSLDFATKAPEFIFSQKKGFRLEFLYEIVPHQFLWPNGLYGVIRGKIVPE